MGPTPCSGDPRPRRPSVIARYCGLQFRSTALMLVVVAAATSLSGALYFRISSRAIMERENTQVQELVRALGAASAEPLLRDDRAELLKTAQRLMLEGEIDYVLFCDRGGRVLAAAQEGEGLLARFLLHDGDHMKIGALDRPALTTLPDGRANIDIVYPIYDMSQAARDINPPAAAGFVRLGHSLERPRRRLAAVRQKVTSVTLGITLLLVPLGFEIVRRIVAPLNELALAAGDLAGGKLDRRVHINRSDEIGRLADAFNAMAGDLAASQNELLRLNAELEDRVLARTEALAASNTRLRHETSEREELLRAVSHDLHAPLRNVAGQAMLLRRRLGELTPEVAHCLERIEQNVREEIRLIEDLLELSRLRTSHEPPRDVDVDDEARAIARQLEYEMERKHIAFVIDGRLPVLRIERRRIRHLLQNLIDNAIKYTPVCEAQTASAEIRIQYNDLGEAHEFRVLDRGIGIRPSDRMQVFNIFSRGRETFVSRTPGKGLGLAFCRSIVRGYGGNIWVEDNPGGGTAACFTLLKTSIEQAVDLHDAADEGALKSQEVAVHG